MNLPLRLANRSVHSDAVVSKLHIAHIKSNCPGESCHEKDSQQFMFSQPEEKTINRFLKKTVLYMTNLSQTIGKGTCKSERVGACQGG